MELYQLLEDCLIKDTNPPKSNRRLPPVFCNGRKTKLQLPCPLIWKLPSTYQDTAFRTTSKIAPEWASADYNHRQELQYMVFPDGI
jgi:hypothetical protein